MLDTKQTLQQEVHRLKGRVHSLPKDDYADPDWLADQIQDINTLPKDAVTAYMSNIDIWTGAEAIGTIQDDVRDLSMQRPRDHREMNIDHRRIETIRRAEHDDQNGLLYLGDDIYARDGQPLTNRELSMVLDVHEALLSE